MQQKSFGRGGKISQSYENFISIHSYWYPLNNLSHFHKYMIWTYSKSLKSYSQALSPPNEEDRKRKDRITTKKKAKRRRAIDLLGIKTSTSSEESSGRGPAGRSLRPRFRQISRLTPLWRIYFWTLSTTSSKRHWFYFHIQIVFALYFCSPVDGSCLFWNINIHIIITRLIA